MRLSPSEYVITPARTTQNKNVRYFHGREDTRRQCSTNPHPYPNTTPHTHNQRSTLQHNINARAPVSSSSRRSSASAGAHIGASVTQIIFLNTITKQNHHQQHTIHYQYPSGPTARPLPPIHYSHRADVLLSAGPWLVRSAWARAGRHQPTVAASTSAQRQTITLRKLNSHFHNNKHHPVVVPALGRRISSGLLFARRTYVCALCACTPTCMHTRARA